MNFEYERLSVTVKNDFVNLDTRLIKNLLFLDRRQPGPIRLVLLIGWLVGW